MLHTYCRLCEGACGLLAEVAADGHLAALHPDPADPVSGGFFCDTARRSVAALRHPERITQPMRRVDGRLQPTDWETAIREIGAQLRAIRGQTGPGSVGLYLGEGVERSSRDWVRALAFGVGMGTPAIFSELCLGAGPRIRAAELMLGTPTVLLPDITRAHSVLLLGGDQRRAGWGPGQYGTAFEAGLAHSRKTKGTRVVVADPRLTDLAADMDQHLAIRPGTEPFLLLGLLSATIQGGWIDRQYVDDYTTGIDDLTAALGPWSLERCADLCGVDRSTLSGVALKFSRAAMGSIHAGPSAFLSAGSGAAAWAWLALHTVTANTLRPGGVYEHRALLDAQPLLTSLPTAAAPRLRGGAPLLLLQAPASLLADEILTPGEGQLRALINLAGDPMGRLPARARTHRALSSLDLLVHVGTVLDDNAAQADWVLPLVHPWEREDTTLHSAALLPVTGVLHTPPVSAAPPEARDAAEILRALFSVVRPGLRGSPWGRHLGLAAHYLVRADLDAWEARVLSWAAEVEADDLKAPPGRIVRGASDRATWRLTTSDGRLHLLPEAVRETFARLSAPAADAAHPLWLWTSRPVDRAPDTLHRAAPPESCAYVHPDSGVADGALVVVETRHGAVQVIARHDAALRPDTVDLSAARVPEALDLLDPAQVDSLTRAPAHVDPRISNC